MEEKKDGKTEEPKGSWVIPYPPDFLFKYRNLSRTAPFKEIMKGENSSFINERYEYPEEGGIYIHCKGTLYPAKGFVFPEGLYAANFAKRITRNIFSLLSGKSLYLASLSAIGWIFMPRKWKISVIERLLTAYTESIFPTLSHFIWEEKRFTPICRELRRIINRFLTGFGINPAISDNFAEIFVCMIEYDGSYRWRLEDIFGMFTKEELLKSPIKTINKAIETYFDREYPHGKTRNESEEIRRNGDTYKVFSKGFAALKYMFYAPYLGKHLRLAFQECDYKNLPMDEGDKYMSMLYNDYDYGGLNVKEREKKWLEIHEKTGLPPRLFYKFE